MSATVMDERILMIQNSMYQYSRAIYRSIKDLTARIGEFIDGWNERCQPFVWTKSADELLAKIRKKETSRAEH